MFVRIVFTHRTQGIGAEGVHIQGMVEAFRAAGHAVQVDCLPGCDPCQANGPGGADAQTAAANAAPGWSIRRGIGGMGRLVANHAPALIFGVVELLYNIPVGWRLWGKLRERPDLVYERYAVGNFAPALVCRARGVPLVVEVNDSVVIARSRATTFPGLNRWIEARVLGSADLVVTVTEHFQARLLAQFPRLQEAQVLVLPNAVARDRFEARPGVTADPAALKARLQLGARTLLGTTGQFLPWHGLARLVEATAPLANAADLEFLFIGDGPARPEVMQTARAAGVEDRVTWTGMVPRSSVPDYLALLDVAVIPACNDHCSPMKLMEFMALGLPVVAPDLPNIREVLEDRRTGRLFRPDDMDDLRACLAEVLADRPASRAMGQRARAHVLANLTWAGHADKIIHALAGRRAAAEGHPCAS